jgi:ankyrin repeat protein
MFSYQRVRQLANAALSYTLGSNYTYDLHEAVENNEAGKVISLLDDDGIYVDLTAYSNMGFPSYVNLKVTPLHIASKNGFFEIASSLLKRKADPHITSNSLETMMSPYFWNALHYALRYEHFDIAELLVADYKVAIDIKALEIIKDNGVVTAIDFLIKHVPEQINDEFIVVVRKKDHEIKALKWYSEQTNSTIGYNDTPHNFLEQAIINGNKILVEGLLEFHYYFENELDVPRYDLAVTRFNNQINQNSPMLEKLKDNSYEINGGLSNYEIGDNINKLSALFLAISTVNPSKEIIKLLITHGVNVSATINGISALQLMRKVFGAEIDNELELFQTQDERKTMSYR